MSVTIPHVHKGMGTRQTLPLVSNTAPNEDMRKQSNLADMINASQTYTGSRP